MKAYWLIASRDPFTVRDVDDFYALAGRLAGEGHPVTLFLVQNGVLPARRGPGAGPLTRLARSGVTVLADDFSLRERGIGAGCLAEGVGSAPIEHVIDALAAGAKAIWS